MNRRDRVRDPREDILLETNFDDDGSTVTRAYNSNSSHSQQPLQPKVRRNGFRSEQSLDRYSVHGRREGTFIVFLCFVLPVLFLLLSVSLYAFELCSYLSLCRSIECFVQSKHIVMLALFYRRLLPIMHDENSICHPNCYTHVSVGRGHFLRNDVPRGFT